MFRTSTILCISGLCIRLTTTNTSGSRPTTTSNNLRRYLSSWRSFGGPLAHITSNRMLSSRYKVASSTGNCSHSDTLVKRVNISHSHRLLDHAVRLKCQDALPPAHGCGLLSKPPSPMVRVSSCEIENCDFPASIIGK